VKTNAKIVRSGKPEDDAFSGSPKTAFVRKKSVEGERTIRTITAGFIPLLGCCHPCSTQSTSRSREQPYIGEQDRKRLGTPLSSLDAPIQKARLLQPGFFISYRNVTLEISVIRKGKQLLPTYHGATNVTVPL
jgi:hypothetical protein